MFLSRKTATGPHTRTSPSTGYSAAKDWYVPIRTSMNAIANGGVRVLIPNGVDCDRFSPGPDARATLGLPRDRLIVLMVSALIPSKFVDIGIDAVSLVPDGHLVVAGTGSLRQSLEARATKLLPGRFHTSFGAT